MLFTSEIMSFGKGAYSEQPGWQNNGWCILSIGAIFCLLVSYKNDPNAAEMQEK